MNSDYSQKEIEPSTIFVAGIPPSTPPKRLKNFFLQFGYLESMEIPLKNHSLSPKGIAFITFQNESIARYLISLGSLMFNKKRIKVEKALEKSEADSITQKSQELKIFARGFPKKTTESQIKEIFENYGDVKKIIMPMGAKKKNSGGLPI